MEFKVNVDCTPEEARTFLGLPDLKPIHDAYIGAVMDAMKGATSVEQMEAMFKQLSPLGNAGLQFFSNMMNFGMNAAGGTNKS